MPQHHPHTPQQTSAPVDLAARFASVLKAAQGRRVSADVLFETLKLEALDWGMDHAIETDTVCLLEQPKIAEDGTAQA